jgi:hypothetical protein
MTRWRRLRMAAAAAVAALGMVVHAADGAGSIHTRRIGPTDDVEGLKKGIRLSVLACRTAKKLPLDAPIPMPPDAVLAKLALAEVEEYFDGANHAKYTTARVPWADPRSGDCEVRLFHERHAMAGQMCGMMVNGSTELLGRLIDTDHPAPPTNSVRPQPATRAGCGRKPRVYDVEGLPVEDAGGAPCVWDADIIAKKMRGAGLQAKGHDPKSPAIDFCLYARRPIVDHDGHHELVVLKSSGGAKDDVMNQLTGMPSAILNHRLVEFSDGTPLPPGRFDEAAVRRFVEQPAITPLLDKP